MVFGQPFLIPDHFIYDYSEESRTSLNTSQVSQLNPHSRSFEHFSEARYPADSELNPLPPNRTGSSNEALLNHTLNPFAEMFSPQSFSILENQGEIFPTLNSAN